MKLFAVGLLAIAWVVSSAQRDNPELGAHLPSQAAADVLREFAGTDGAFLAAGLVKGSFQKDDLSSLVQYPSDEVVVITITGSQVRQAFERSLSLLPQSNTSFLQISGFEVVYSKDKVPGQRVIQVRCNGNPLEESKNYQIAMPSSLGRGGLGYFKIWDKAKITKTFPDATIESVLKAKRYVDSSPRWVVSGS
ncbi:MAG: 5'-nucleotidase C-terminal domain-containing protein [Fimbriimonadaceae bacterium]|nr:5'-nucleotidase C-terminal domain-containing protein [Fimbriimonadaceae bacterium]